MLQTVWKWFSGFVLMCFCRNDLLFWSDFYFEGLPRKQKTELVCFLSNMECGFLSALSNVDDVTPDQGHMTHRSVESAERYSEGSLPTFQRICQTERQQIKWSVITQSLKNWSLSQRFQSLTSAHILPSIHHWSAVRYMENSDDANIKKNHQLLSNRQRNENYSCFLCN